MTPSPHSIAATTVAILALGTAAASAQVVPVETLAAATPVAAHDGTAMWSRLDAATGRYQLVTSIGGGVPTPVAVPQRDGAFDVDLGANRAGNTYAVYTRDGDIYRLDPRTGVEKKLTKLSSPDRAERSPAIWQGRIAFVRHVKGMDQLRIGDTTSVSKGTRLLLERKAIDSIELGSKHVAWTDRFVKGKPSSQYQVHIRNIATGADRMVYRAGGGGASFTTVTKPAFADSSFLWAVARKGAAGSRIVKYTLRTGKLSYAQGTPRHASMAWAGGALGAIVSDNDAGDPYAGTADCGCGVAYTGPLTFNLKP
jgi:hypothetical protein